MPCTELFDAQNSAYRRNILPADMLIVSIEAGVTYGWDRYTGIHGLRIGIDSFGASAPAEDLFTHFGFSADAIIPKIMTKLQN
jgi:transketolase